MPIMDFIFYLSLDYQSVNEGLSTFGAEIKEIKGLINSMKNGNGLCVLDEFAKGTNPEEGEIIVKSLARWCEGKGSFCFISTHYSNVVEKGMTHLQVKGLKDVKGLLTVDNPKILQDLMDYRIESVQWDSPTPQDAVTVAELMGIQSEFLDLIKEVREEHKGEQAEP